MKAGIYTNAELDKLRKIAEELSAEKGVNFKVRCYGTTNDDGGQSLSVGLIWNNKQMVRSVVLDNKDVDFKRHSVANGAMETATNEAVHLLLKDLFAQHFSI